MENFPAFDQACESSYINTTTVKASDSSFPQDPCMVYYLHEWLICMVFMWLNIPVPWILSWSYGQERWIVVLGPFTSTGSPRIQLPQLPDFELYSHLSTSFFWVHFGGPSILHPSKANEPMAFGDQSVFHSMSKQVYRQFFECFPHLYRNIRSSDGWGARHPLLQKIQGLFCWHLPCFKMHRGTVRSLPFGGDGEPKKSEKLQPTQTTSKNNKQFKITAISFISFPNTFITAWAQRLKIRAISAC